MATREIKKCKKCGENKDISDFYSKSAMCKKCQIEYGRNPVRKTYQSAYSQTPQRKEYRKKYYAKAREINRKKKEEYLSSEEYKNNILNSKIKRKEYLKLYGQSEKRKKYKLEYNKKDLATKLRCRLNGAIKRKVKVGSPVKDLGCSIEELKEYLRSKFKDGMTWENHGKYGWHIDHIVPLAKFNLENREEFLKAVHYSNLQPLWAHENLSKGAR